MKFCINIEFDNKVELDNYVKELEEFTQWKVKRKEKKENDGRGKKTHLLHQIAKSIIEETNIPYREALRQAGKKLKENN